VWNSDLSDTWSPFSLASALGLCLPHTSPPLGPAVQQPVWESESFYCSHGSPDAGTCPIHLPKFFSPFKVKFNTFPCKSGFTFSRLDQLPSWASGGPHYWYLFWLLICSTASEYHLLVTSYVLRVRQVSRTCTHFFINSFYQPSSRSMQYTPRSLPVLLEGLKWTAHTSDKVTVDSAIVCSPDWGWYMTFLWGH
jgi:hypothetical protein